MADILQLVCTKHKEYLWIGQLRYGQPETAYIYTVPEEREKQQRFIKRHALCEPVLLNDAALERIDDEGDFVEFEGEESGVHPSDSIMKCGFTPPRLPITWGK